MNSLGRQKMCLSPEQKVDMLLLLYKIRVQTSSSIMQLTLCVGIHLGPSALPMWDLGGQGKLMQIW